MIPVLMAKDAITLDANGHGVVPQSLGIGALSDTVDCTVSEERNGAFSLDLKTPASGEMAEDINVGNLIVADASPSQPWQAFEIYNVKKSIDGYLSVKANHIGYRLAWSVIRPFNSLTGIDAVISRLNNKTGSVYVFGNAFEFGSTLTNTSSTFKLSDYRSVKSLLGGSDGSILQKFGGCYKYDNFKVDLLASRGSDKGVKLLYGKNLTSLNADYDLGQIPTGCFPVWTSDSTTVAGTTVARSQYADLYPYTRVVVHDFADQFDSQPTAAQLNTAAASWITGKGLPNVNLQASFVFIQDEELENVEIDDTVHVYVKSLDVDVTAKVIKTVYEPMKNRYKSVEVGNFRTSITDAIRSVRG